MRCLMICLSLAMAACTQAAPSIPDEAGLPSAAIRAFQSHVAQMSEGRLDCSAAQINAAPHLAADLNGDSRTDYVLDAARLDCQLRPGFWDDNYFCGLNICVFPLLVSEGETWRVITLMSGNAVELAEHYRETWVRVSQGNFGIAGGDLVQVREYAWRDGQLRRIAERQESPA